MPAYSFRCTACDVEFQETLKLSEVCKVGDVGPIMLEDLIEKVCACGSKTFKRIWPDKLYGYAKMSFRKTPL